MKGSEFKKILKKNKITIKQFCIRYGKSQSTLTKYTRTFSNREMPKEYDVLLKNYLIEERGILLCIKNKI